MKKIKIIYWVCLLAALPLYFSEAKVRLPALVGDGMVLQRDQPIQIWGYADEGEKVTVIFQEKHYVAVADCNGDWSVLIPSMQAGGPYMMEVNDLLVNDILIGDVWLCSGQSNMELPVARVMDMFRDEVEAYGNPLIRHIKIPLVYDFHSPQSDVQPVSWKRLTPENALSFSAVGYFFAKEIIERTGVPIGLINASVGGSPAEAWISENGLRDFPHYCNEKDICRSDAYVSAVKNLDNMRRNLWHKILYRNDQGLKEGKVWFGTICDDSDWLKADLFDKSWGTDGINPINGSHWLRKTFTITSSQAKEAALLRLGCIVDADSVFINGQFVGSTGYQYPPRIYPIASNVLKEGDNNITLRLISYSGRPGIVEDKPYKLIVGDEEISLDGDWKYKLGVRMPALPGETFFQYKPTGLYNAMIAPLKNYTFKGVLWYQGESNTDRPNEYYDLMNALITDWRTLWKQPDLPFIVVQLANFMKDPLSPSESNWAELRNAQLRLTQTIPNTGLVVTIDIGEWNDIHPLNKKEVGKRLSLQAEKIAYKNTSVISDGPLLDNTIPDGNRLILCFKEGTGDLSPVSKLHGFAIAGRDGEFQWAHAVVEGDRVIVWHDDISEPVRLRYAWGHNPSVANLRNKAGLPASPFEISLPLSVGKE